MNDSNDDSFNEPIIPSQSSICHAFVRDGHPLFAELSEKTQISLDHSAVDSDFPRLVRKMKLTSLKIINLDQPLASSEAPSSSSEAPSSSSEAPSSSSEAPTPTPAPSSSASSPLPTSPSTPSLSSLPSPLFPSSSSVITSLDTTLTSDRPDDPRFRDRDLLMQDVLVFLCRHLSCSAKPVRAHFLPAVSYDPQVDVHSRAVRGDINRFLLAHFGEQHRLVRLLKACNQSMLAPAVVFLKLRLNASVGYKDCKGIWFIDVAFIHLQDALSEIVVTHRKREISLTAEAVPASHFEFSWEVRLHYDPDMTLLFAELDIVDLFFNPQFPQERAAEVRQQLILAVSAQEPPMPQYLPPSAASTSTVVPPPPSDSSPFDGWSFDIDFDQVVETLVTPFNTFSDWISTLID